MIWAVVVRPAAGTACTDASTSRPDSLERQPAEEPRDIVRHTTQQTNKETSSLNKRILHFLLRFHFPEPATATGAVRKDTYLQRF